MDYKIIWSDSALADPDSICSYIARRDPDAAERVGLAIFDQVGTLARFPFKGHPYRRGASGNLREVACPPHRIFYDVDESRQRVEILHIWHSARRDPEL